jgi:hypothetical protein
MRRALSYCIVGGLVSSAGLWLANGWYGAAYMGTHTAFFASRGAIQIQYTSRAGGLFGPRMTPRWIFGEVVAPGWDNEISWVQSFGRLDAKVPMWAITGAFLLATMIACLPPCYRRFSRYRSQCCLACGYSLRGLISTMCPECGKPHGLAMTTSD